MSIRAEIASRCDPGDGRLAYLPPALPGAPHVRTMIVSPEIYAAACGPWKDAEEEYRCSQLRAYLDQFTEGMLISVGRGPFKKRADAFLVRLHEAEDEVWEIRVRPPKPGIRVFGRFSEKDIFVALTWVGREILANDSKEWRDARELCKAKWRQLIPTYPPLTGADFGDYVSNFIVV